MLTWARSVACLQCTHSGGKADGVARLLSLNAKSKLETKRSAGESHYWQIEMRHLSAALGVVLVIGLSACTSSDQERAKEQGSQDLRKANDEAKKAGRELKADAKELSRRVDAAVQPDTESASHKLSRAEATAKEGASRAGVKLDHAVLLAKVKTKLMSDAGLSTVGNVDVALNGTVVTLSGTVANENQKKAAEQAASQVDGVTKVQDLLTVQP